MRRELSLGLATLAALALATPAAYAAGAPTITATWVTTVSTTAANLRAEVNPQGQGATYRFEYTTEASFKANGFIGASKVPAGSEPSIGSGSIPVAVVQHIGALKANSAYRYRVVATNASGPTEGPARPLSTDELAPTFSLPDSRGWEMVSPIDKNGGEIQGFGANFGGDVLQAKGDGQSATYTSSSSFAGGQGAPGASQYLSRRTTSGWTTENISGPTDSGAYGDKPDGVPFQLFSGDLQSALLLDGHRCEAPDPCQRSYSLRDNAGSTVAALPFEEPDLDFAGATPDLTHLVFSTCAALTADATEVPGPPGECDSAKANLYERSGSAALRLINLLPGDVTGTPGAALAAQGGAISADGTRVYFTHEGDLYLRDANRTLQVDEGVGGGGAFQTASADGSVAYFTKAAHLYRYELSSETATDLTPGGEVKGVLGASGDGSYLYYLTNTGLMLWHSATTTPVAPSADAVNYPPATGSAWVSADGRSLAFLSSAELTSYDPNGFPEAYLYDATGAGTLTCASCNPSGERPLGAASIPGASPNGTGFAAYKPRALSADGRRLFFDSFDALVPQDTNNDRDVYQWEAQGTGSCQKPGGCINLISSGRAEGGASFIDASTDGGGAFFLTDGSLVPSDPGSVDLYVARVGGGFPLSPSVIPCLGDACQPLPPEPEDPTPGTLRTREGNPPLALPKPSCKKGQVRKKGKCVKAKQHKKKKHHHKKGGHR